MNIYSDRNTNLTELSTLKLLIVLLQLESSNQDLNFLSSRATQSAEDNFRESKDSLMEDKQSTELHALFPTLQMSFLLKAN